MGMENVGWLFLQRARLLAEQPAIEGDQFEITYGQLHDAVIAFALNLLDRGIGQRRTVALYSEDPVVVLTSVFATALTGSRWVSVPKAQLEAASVQPDTILAGADLDNSPEEAVRLDESWAVRPKSRSSMAQVRFPGFQTPSDTWLLQSTSGTTGTPKLVPISHEIAAKRYAATGDLVGRQGAGVSGLFLPTASALLTRYPAVLLHGGKVVHSADPETWLRSGVELVVGSPAQIKVCLGGRVLSRKIARVHGSGGRLTDALVKELAQSFGEVANGYGSTETNNCLSNLKRINADGTVTTLTRLREGVTIEIVDEANRPVPAGTQGSVRVRTPYLATTYLNAPDAAQVAFQDGWFYPGDMGFWTVAGEFVVTGRQNDQFNIGGVKVNALLIDAALQSVKGVKDAICFMLPRPDGERLTAFLSLEPGRHPSVVLAEARVAVIRAAGKDLVPERFLFAEKLPRNANGKPDRARCVALVEAARSRH